MPNDAALLRPFFRNVVCVWYRGSISSLYIEFGLGMKPPPITAPVTSVMFWYVYGEHTDDFCAGGRGGEGGGRRRGVGASRAAEGT